MKKKLTTTMMMLAATAFSASAQEYTTLMGENCFDLTRGTDYVVIYAPESVVNLMGDRLLSDQNLDPDNVKNQFYYWVTDWDKSKLVLCNVEEEEGTLNSWGTEDVLNMTPLYAWGGGNFGSIAGSGFVYDLSGVTDEHVLHIGLRDMGNAPSKYRFTLGLFNDKSIPKVANGLKIEVNAPVGSDNGGYIGAGSIGHDGNWYSLDIPMSDLLDEDGDFGFETDWSQAFPEGASVFTVAFDSPTVSKAKGTLEPGKTVETYEITELGSALSLDAVFFYKPAASTPTAIKSTGTQRNTTGVQTYDLCGRPNDGNKPGIYVVRKDGSVKKMVRK